MPAQVKKPELCNCVSCRNDREYRLQQDRIAKFNKKKNERVAKLQKEIPQQTSNKLDGVERVNKFNHLRHMRLNTFTKADPTYKRNLEIMNHARINGTTVNIAIQHFPKAFQKLKNEKVKDCIFMGWEWETTHEYQQYGFPEANSKSREDCRRVYIRRFYDQGLGDYINMRSENDLEMVSIPASLAFHKKLMDESFFSKDLAKHIKYSSNNGMHVHIGKCHFTPAAAANFIALINQPLNISFIERTGGRSLGSYCGRIYGIEVDAKGDHNIFVDNALNTRFQNRTKATSIGFSYPNTVEVRLFKTPVTREEFYKNLEFCDAAVRFCLSLGASKQLKDTSYRMFRNYVQDYATLYPNLWNHIKDF